MILLMRATLFLFSDKKLVLVKNSQLFARGGKSDSDSSDNKSQQILKDYFAEIPEPLVWSL